jgi:Fe-S-cluster containining protein
MSTKQSILDNYDKLCSYCDSFFSSIRKLHSDDMQCKKGCGACCKLRSVCALEAFVITRHVATQKSRTLPQKKGDLRRHTCAMLKNKGCMIYAARPVICRTHGLAISIDKRKDVDPTCALNFSTKRDVRTLPKPHVFDSAIVTDNLMRLNMAFCLAVGHGSLASKRFTMEQVLSGKLPKSIL